MNLNTTAYSLLGLFNKRPWSAYELAGFMKNSVMQYILPRTRSQLFNEPKKLAKLGLLNARVEAQGKRNRTIYEITPAGREAFASWLAEPGETIKTEYISLLKLYLTTPDDHNALLARIQEMKQQVMEEIQSAMDKISYILERGLIMSDTALTASATSRLAADSMTARLKWLSLLEAQLNSPSFPVDLETMALENYQETLTHLKQLQSQFGE